MLLVLTLNRIDVINWTPNRNVSLHPDAFMVKLDCTHIIYSVSFLFLHFQIVIHYFLTITIQMSDALNKKEKL